MTVTIPQSTATLPIGTEITLARFGTGTVTIASASTSVSILSANSKRAIAARYGVCRLKRLSSGEWALWGDLG